MQWTRSVDLENVSEIGWYTQFCCWKEPSFSTTDPTWSLFSFPQSVQQKPMDYTVLQKEARKIDFVWLSLLWNSLKIQLGRHKVHGYAWTYNLAGNGLMTSHQRHTLHALPLEFHSVMHKTRKCIFKMRFFFLLSICAFIYTNTCTHSHLLQD